MLKTTNGESRRIRSWFCANCLISRSKIKAIASLCFQGVLVCVLFIQPIFFAQDEHPATADQVQSKQQSFVQISESDLIHFGDLIEIDVVGSSDFDWRGTLTSEGFLEGFAFSDEPIYGLCSSEKDVSQAVASAFRKFLRDPEVKVKILDRSNRPVSIISGAIKTPQRFQIKRTVLLNELLTISGGLTDKASGEIQIFRPRDLNCLSVLGLEVVPGVQNVELRERYIAASQDNGSQFINIKISDLLSGKDASNPQILGGDIVTVLESQPIYVIGGVENPTQIAARSQMTLTRAIASAGGISRDADETKITIFRRGNGESKIINANLQKIIGKAEEDVLLQAFDIVDVSQSGKEARTAPPLIDNVEQISGDKLRLPLRIID